MTNVSCGGLPKFACREHINRQAFPNVLVDPGTQSHPDNPHFTTTCIIIPRAYDSITYIIGFDHDRGEAIDAVRTD